MKPRLLISFSGGRTSAFMTQWLLKNMAHKYEMKVVFANTGKERAETLEFVQLCDEYFGFNLIWVEAVVNQQRAQGVGFKVVDFETANRNGGPFESIIKKFGLPNRNNSFCSRDLKGGAIKAYLRSVGWRGDTFSTALGIRSDEPQRINIETAAKNRIIYPLASTIPTTKSDINFFWSKQPFDLKLKSYEGNCDLCWKKSYRKLMTLVKELPVLADWWQEMESKYENHLGEARKRNPNIKLPMRFYRENKSINDIIGDSNNPFSMAEDESKEISAWSQLTFAEMVNSYQPDLDEQEGGCGESCEAFAAPTFQPPTKKRRR